MTRLGFLEQNLGVIFRLKRTNSSALLELYLSLAIHQYQRL
jgi:hypothetical protein